MITLTVKQGNTIIRDTQVTVQCSDRYVSIAELQSFIAEIEPFFPNRNIAITLQLSTKHFRYHRSYGLSYYMQGSIKLWNMPYSASNHLFAVIAHELGHQYHYAYSYADFIGLTPYGQELFADDFSAMVMGKDFNDSLRSYYPSYEGYSTKTVYKNEQLMNKKIGT